MKISVHKNIFLFFLATTLSLPITFRGQAKAEEQFTFVDEQILAIADPVMKEVEIFKAKHPPAQTMGVLQKQILDFLALPAVQKSYKIANQELNSIARTENHFGPYSIPNYYVVSQGVFRSANPSLDQAKKLISSGKVDAIVALNIDLKRLVDLDPDPTIALTAERKKIILDKLQSNGKGEDNAEHLVDFYEKNFDYALAIQQKTYSWLNFYPLGNPKKTLSGFFDALKKVNELRKAQKKVLIHCTVGKHRTGLTAMLIKVLDNSGNISDEMLRTLYTEFIKLNWNEKADSRVHYMAVLPLIVRSVPFQEIAQNWKQRFYTRGSKSVQPGAQLDEEAISANTRNGFFNSYRTVSRRCWCKRMALSACI